MELSGNDRCWDDRVREAVKLGSEKLRDLLLKEPPPSKEKYILCLEHIYHYHQEEKDTDVIANRYPQVLQKERFTTLFDILQNNPATNTSFHSTEAEKQGDNYSARPLRQHRRDAQAGKPPLNLISFYDLFVASIVKWRDGRENDQQNADHLELMPFKELNCSPLTKLIWEANRKELFRGGAIHACAQYGLDKFLEFLLGPKIRRELRHDVNELLKFGFLAGPDTDLTPLGIAIREQHFDCIPPLLSIKNAGRYIKEGKNVLEDGVTDMTLLHQVLDWTKSDTAFVDTTRRSAIVKARAKCIEKIINIFPEFLAQHNSDGIPPYRYAYSLRDRFGTDTIHTTLHTAIFDFLKLDIDEVRTALYTKSGKELGLDLSDFNHQSDYFLNFVNNLGPFNELQMGKNWCFEETLLYLNLPHLDSPRVEPIIRLLQWLKSKNVKKVLHVRLPDCKAQYDIDTFVHAEILKKFKIVRLDWIRRDVDVHKLIKLAIHEKSSVVSSIVIDLYSSATFSGLADFKANVHDWKDVDQWAQNIEAINLHIVEPELPSIDRPSDLKESSQNATENRKSIIHEFKAPLGNNEVFQNGEMISWNRFISKQVIMGAALEDYESQMADDLQKCHKFLNMFEKPSMPHTLSPRLKHCMEVFKDSKVKVAVIDNGVDQMNSNLRENIKHGASFVRAGGATEIPELPWYTAADPHGTHMAYLIYSINPWCQLFPVRVGTMQKDIDAGAAIKAVEWAIAQKVDVISISWVMMKCNTELEKVIQRAVQDENILVYCSTADIGSQSHSDVYPANYDGLVTAVSASDRFGWARLESCHDVHIMLGGENVTAHGPQYMLKQSHRISGSSVATALAAGLASLCLFLARMANKKSNWNEFKNRDTMLRIFRKMQESDSNRVITPAKLFDGEFEVKDDFWRGSYDPPEGLSKLDWAVISKEIEYPRRERSKERSKLAERVEARRGKTQIAMRS